MEHELGLALLELDHVRLHDAGNGVSAAAHAPAVDLVARIHQGDVAHHGAGLLGEDVQLLAQGPQRHLKVLQDAVALVLVSEGLLLGAGHRVQPLVEHATEAQGLVRGDEVLHAAAVQHGLHEALGLVQVEELPVLAGLAHLQDALAPVPDGVAAGARGNGHLRLATAQGGLGHRLRHLHDLALGALVSLLAPARLA
jgi:hypothetical protein